MRIRTAARWRAPRTPGQMNKTESRFAVNLEVQKQAGEIVDYLFEPMKVRLGKDWKCSYTPDFMILHNNGIMELVDVKGGGGWESAARVKIKAAASQYPMFEWSGQTEVRSGEFKRELFSTPE